MNLTGVQKSIIRQLSPGFGGTEIPDYLKRLLDQGLGAVTLFGSNTPDIETTSKLVGEIREYNSDCLISIDEESGDVTRIWAKTGSPFPSPHLLGRVNDPSLTEQVYFSLGASLASAGLDLTFGPVLDLTISITNPIVGVRSFGSDPALVSDHGAAAIAGLQAAGISAAAKHFPGHGGTSADSHHNLPVLAANLEQLSARDLRPFVTAIESGVKAIMMGHLLAPAVDEHPASMSSVWIEEVLRGQLGFKGLIVTDALDMGALGGVQKIDQSAMNALRAGADLLCLSGIANQEQLVMSILDLAANTLSEFDLENAENSHRRIQKVRRTKGIEPAFRPIDPSRLKSGIACQGEIHIDRTSTAVLTLEAAPTIAAGQINWGVEGSLQSLGCESREFDTARSRVVQFRDAWRDPVILERLEMIRVEHPDAVFVDFGWPTYSFEAKNLVRAFGATKIHSDCVADLLVGNR